jgi:hypothetical protein
VVLIPYHVQRLGVPALNFKVVPESRPTLA